MERGASLTHNIVDSREKKIKNRQKKGGETVEPVELVRYGTPVLVLGMLLFLERINSRTCSIQEDIRELKRSITRQETCNARHEEINRRFERVESELSARAEA
jgi:hypothetical protein